MLKNGVGSSLVNLHKVNPRILLDIRYATDNNFMGFPIYSHALCFVHKNVAEALERIQVELESKGLGLKVYDGFRPIAVQQAMWDRLCDERYVSNPAKSLGPHTRGAAVDVTLVNTHGQELEMPSGFDEFTERAHLNYAHGSKASLQHREILQKTMTAHGFEPLETEWWHFHIIGWKDDALYPPLDFSLEDLD